MKRSRRQFCTDLASVAGLACLPDAVQAAMGSGKQPNIVLFLIDDLGWGDFGCYGNTFHQTPNIDRLAQGGMRFTNAYASAPVCSPSRAAIMTGQSPAKLHLTQWIPGVVYPHKKLLEAPSDIHLNANTTTLAELLRRQGYQTAAIGKWHLGGEGFLPENFGFEVNVAGDDSGHPPSYFGPYHFHNLSGYTKQDYLTEVLTQKMDDFVQQASKKGPFFLYMAEYSVHIPLQARQELIAEYRRKNGGKDEPDPVYAAMIDSTDRALGSLLQTLQRAGVAENTIIVVTSDNGGVGFQGAACIASATMGPSAPAKVFFTRGGSESL